MASVRLNFRPPTDTGIDKLHIYEAAAKEGPFGIIETVEEVGTYPDYITEYSTQLATDAENWFAIEWESTKGVLSGMSAPMQGGTENLVSEITDRVILRDNGLNENVVAQEAEAVVEEFFPDRLVREVMSNEATYRQISGMVLLTWARAALLTSFSSSSGAGWTAGLVSLKPASSTARDFRAIGEILKQANVILNRSYSVVMLMEEIEVADGVKTLQGIDLSRVMVEYG